MLHLPDLDEDAFEEDEEGGPMETLRSRIANQYRTNRPVTSNRPSTVTKHKPRILNPGIIGKGGKSKSDTDGWQSSLESKEDAPPDKSDGWWDILKELFVRMLEAGVSAMAYVVFKFFTKRRFSLA